MSGISHSLSNETFAQVKVPMLTNTLGAKDKLNPMFWIYLKKKKEKNNPETIWNTPSRRLLIPWQSLPSKDAFMPSWI